MPSKDWNSGNPEGRAWQESRGAPCRQGAGDVANLPCLRETAVEKEVSELHSNGNRRDATREVEKAAARCVRRQGWKGANGSGRMGKCPAGEGDVGAGAGEKGRLCPRIVELLRAQERRSLSVLKIRLLRKISNFQEPAFRSTASCKLGP